MILFELKKDLFKVDPKYYLAHCIASDLRMGMGIALPMAHKFDLKNKILKTGHNVKSPTCILTGRVFNLITKDCSIKKPSYQSLEQSLILMRDICVQNQVKFLAMPKIGCGLDRLDWWDVKGIIEDVFLDVDIEILICSL